MKKTGRPLSKSKTEWTNETWNPVTKSSKVTDEGHIQCHSEKLETPLHWKKPRMIFVNSTSDLFHESIPFDSILRVFEIMNKAQQHTFQILTKRPERALEFFHHFGLVPDNTCELTGSGESVPSNVWLGVSVENQATANERIPALLQCPAAVHWISAEPLIGKINLNYWMEATDHCGSCDTEHHAFPRNEVCPNCSEDSLITTWGEKQANNYRDGTRYSNNCSDMDGGNLIAWVVVSGESGSKARPMHPDWARSLRDQCEAANVPFAFKQWGEWGISDEIERLGIARHGWWEDCPEDGGVQKHDWKDSEFPSCSTVSYRVGKKSAGSMLDGIKHEACPTTKYINHEDYLPGKENDTSKAMLKPIQCPSVCYAVGEKERLTATSIKEAVRDYIDETFPDTCAKTVMVQGYKPMIVSIGDEDLESLIERLDEEYGDPDGDGHEITNRMKEAWKLMSKVIISEYQPWAHEPNGNPIEMKVPIGKKV